MKKKSVIIIISILFIIGILVGGYFYWASQNKITLSYITLEGEEKSMVIPAILGVDKQDEIVTECSITVNYNIKISQISPLEASPQIKEIIKEKMQSEGWILTEEKKIGGFWAIVFLRSEEKLTATTGAYEDLHTVDLL